LLYYRLNLVLSDEFNEVRVYMFGFAHMFLTQLFKEVFNNIHFFLLHY
jgi:hypothetical protein